MAALKPMERPDGTRDVRADILHVTLELIGDHGIGGVTNRRIAQAAGISLGTLTYHFASQHQLLAEALSEFVSGEVQRLATISTALQHAEISAGEAAHRAQEIVEFAVTRREQIAQFELYLHAARDADTMETARRCYAAYDELAAATLGALGAADPARGAAMLIALMDGFALRRLATGEQSDDLATLLGAIQVVFTSLQLLAQDSPQP